MRKLGIGLDRSVNKIGSIPLDPDAVIYFAAATSAGASVTAPYRDYYNNTIIALKNNGEWAKRDSIFIFATGVGVSEATRKIWSKIWRIKSHWRAHKTGCDGRW